MEVDWKTLNKLSFLYGDSFYLLDSRKFEQNYDEFLKAFRAIYPKTFIAYSYKTNYIPKLCLIVQQKGGYAEVASEMELELAMRLGVSPKKIIYNGPYKSEKSVEECLLGGGIVNLDSIYEVDIIEKIAHKHSKATISVGVRCNFKIDDSFSRFGFDVKGKDFYQVFERLRNVRNVKVKGIHCHFPHRDIHSFIVRVEKMLTLAKKLFSPSPEFIDIGGGFCGKMDEILKKQFRYKVPTFKEYARVIATKFRDFYKNLNESKKPKLFLEPGTALVADAMKFVVKVVDIKKIQNKLIAVTSGSKFNINPRSKINLPITVYKKYEKKFNPKENKVFDIGGYTCVEDDYLSRRYKGILEKGDFIVFNNVGSYSIVLKPPFILPNCAVLEYNYQKKKYEIIKKKESFDDIFKTFIF